MQPDLPDQNSDDTPNLRAGRTRRYLAIGLGGVCAVSLVVLAMLMARGQSLPTLDRQVLEAAKQRWATVAPGDYDIETRVQGRQPALYRVQVRNHQVILATCNGTPQKQPRTWGTWSVPGMLGTIETDVRNVERVEQGQNDAYTPQLTLRAQIHPHWGYPERYRRIQWGSHVEVTWEVTRFEVVPSVASTIR